MPPWEERIERRLVTAMQAVIAAILAWGLYRFNASVIVNGLVDLGVTFLPGVLERDFEITIGPWLTFLITLGTLLHTVGMVGPYDTIWWWDNLTHTLSASIVAIGGYAITRALDEYVEEIYLPPDFTYLFIVVTTLALGVFWEVLEFLARELAAATGQRAVLVQYGVSDSVLDLLFDAGP